MSHEHICREPSGSQSAHLAVAGSSTTMAPQHYRHCSVGFALLAMPLVILIGWRAHRAARVCQIRGFVNCSSCEGKYAHACRAAGEVFTPIVCLVFGRPMAGCLRAVDAQDVHSVFADA